MTSALRRAGWIFLAVLFIATGLGVGVVGFWQATHQKVDTEENQVKTERLKGAKLAEFTPVAKVDSLQSIDLVAGTGAEVKPGATVTVQYTGAVAATGTIFESSIDTGQPVTFSLNQVIKGWTNGLPGMKVNGQRRLLIPADLAYGANPPLGSGIPANADLVFDIVLLDVK
ncbi:FKBP-type peptidyl-prolyl cis-trans isomerase [Candidatus Saccharibacteria bacterium]|nr:FKBP-type peptidyl-prolyl cis-trans isomerase [Candidatus Saccharibacteria bacterium]